MFKEGELHMQQYPVRTIDLEALRENVRLLRSTLPEKTKLMAVVKAGDEVTLMGSDGAETITPDELGSWSDTIGYEVLLAATERVRRVWLHEHE